jgi:transcriptional regulator with XRE-family HTH domain
MCLAQALQVLSSISKSFGTAVRNRRVALGLSQERLAEAAGLHPTYVSMVERGIRNPTLNVAGRIASALEISLPQLIDRAESRHGGKKGRRAS